MHKLFYIIIFSIWIIPVFAQEPVSTTVLSKDYNIPTSLGTSTSSSQSPVAVGVDHFTGRVQLNIPLGNAGDAFTQVSLSYSSGGFKPSTPSTTLGLGWNLVCGGAISRQVRGIPDEVTSDWKDEVNNDLTKNVSQELSEFRINNFDPVSPHFKLGTNDRWEPGEDRFVEKMASGKYDTQCDIFTINAPGISGTFILKTGDEAAGQNAPTLPKIEFLGPTSLEVIPNWKIIWSNGLGRNVVKGINSFVVKAPDGSEYYFSKIVQSASTVEIKKSGVRAVYNKVWDGSNWIYQWQDEAISDGQNAKPTTIENQAENIGWLLDKVKLPNGDEIIYYFMPELVTTKSFKKNQLSNPNFIAGNAEEIGSYSKKEINEYTFIQKINTFSVVKIISSTGIVDLSYSSGILNPQGSTSALIGVQFYQFGRYMGGVHIGYNYLHKDGGTISTSLPNPQPSVSRLVLGSLCFFDQYGNSRGNNSFRYFDGQGLNRGGFPGFDNLYLDHWGFASYFNFNGDYFEDINRRVDGQIRSLPHKQQGIIKEIETSDGTKFEFEYDHNQSLENLKNNYFTWEIVGGLRVTKISRKSPIENEPVRTREFHYGRSDRPFSFDFDAQTWRGGFPIYSQVNQNPYDEDFRNISYRKSNSLGILTPYKDQEGDLRIPRFLIKYQMVQSTPVYQLEDEMGRSVVYTRVMEKNEKEEFVLYEFKEPEFITNYPARITSGYNIQSPIQSSSISPSLWQWISNSYQINILNNSFIQFLTGLTSKVYSNSNTGFSTLSQIPDEISKFENYEYRFSYSRQLDISKSGGQTLMVKLFDRQKNLSTINEIEYSFFSREKIKSVNINGLINYQVVYPGEPNMAIYQSTMAAVKSYYIGDYFPTVSNMLGIGSFYIYRAYDENIGGYLAVRTTQTSYDRKIGNSGFVQEIKDLNLISDPSNFHLFGKPRSIYEKKINRRVGHNDQVLQESWVQLRYPSDFLTSTERAYLDNEIYSNPNYLTEGNANRTDFAFAHLTHGVQDEGPIETFSYTKAGDGNWFLTKAEISLPYGWGNKNAPLISSQFQYTYPIKSKMGKDPDTGIPTGFVPVDWSIGSGFSIDPGYEKSAQVLEVDAVGNILSSVSLIKRPGTNAYVSGEVSSKILGYKKTLPIAEIAMAKGSECAYTSFEMPIVNSSDENWWAVYTFPKEGETIPYGEVVNEGFTGGKSVRVNYSFGPTYSLPVDETHLKDYIFEAWVKKAENTTNTSTGKLVAYLNRGSDPTPKYEPPLVNNTFTCTNEWQQIKVKIPLQNATPSGTGPLFLRLYSESSKPDSNSPLNTQGFLIDECRVYPADALVKTQSIDLTTGSSYSVDAKGKIERNLVSPGVRQSYGSDGTLRSLSILNAGK